jgi:hypothetical protein
VLAEARENVREVGSGSLPQADLWCCGLFSTGYLFGMRAEVERLARPVPRPDDARRLIALAARPAAPSSRGS